MEKTPFFKHETFVYNFNQIVKYEKYGNTYEILMSNGEKLKVNDKNLDLEEFIEIVNP